MAAAVVPFLPTLAEEKTLRASFIRDEDERPKVPYNQFSSDIPVISLASIDEKEDKGTGSPRGGSVPKDSGGPRRHSGLIADMTRLSKEFFALPPEEKLRFDMSGGKKGGFIVSSHLQGEAVQDWREIVTYFSYPVRVRDYSRWPDKPEGWPGVVEAYSEQLMGLACKLLGVLSEAMGLETEALTKACVDMDQKVVVNYYPNVHTDPGTITLLLQDQVGGLQATKDGGKTWITVQPVEGAFVVNLGDHGHFLSNGRFKNADHQAVVNSNCSRLSIATFQNPAPEAIVYPLAIREGEKAVLDKPITFAEMYRMKMSRDLELAKLKKEVKEGKQDALIVAKDTIEKKDIVEILA
ncbi:unnamed protein product [Spirodela intermedia]|uniref:flavanone 3-dioxygenase n=1 Tax=Spirodela intermedia TaxID=51605 RepID=A0A7I8IDS9_SPIIN|nr:unnamed protein product [Spirodela intermedia]CAA6655926.1 unnamed protein product [Spirodela intermedia]